MMTQSLTGTAAPGLIVLPRPEKPRPISGAMPHPGLDTPVAAAMNRIYNPEKEKYLIPEDAEALRGNIFDLESSSPAGVIILKLEPRR